MASLELDMATEKGRHTLLLSKFWGVAGGLLKAP